MKIKKNKKIRKFSIKKQEYDLCKKEWGFYATPSINSRLKNNNFTTLIVQGKKFGKFYIHIVDKKKINVHKKYLKSEKLKIIKWPKELNK